MKAPPGFDEQSDVTERGAGAQISGEQQPRDNVQRATTEPDKIKQR